MSEAPGKSPAALPAWPRRPQRLATAVVEALVDRIVAGVFPSGSSLPIEPLLCETFAVSRTVVREAVKSLEAMKLVEVRQGSGTTVRPLDDWDLVNPVVLAAVVSHDEQLAILDDVIDVRCALEGQMAAQAAGQLSEAHLRRLDELLGGLARAVDDPDHYLDLDVAFHDVIMDGSGNRLGRAVIHTVNAEAFSSVRYIGAPTRHDCEKSNAGHRKIYEALVRGDAETASAAMSEHIKQSWLRRRPTATASRATASATASGRPAAATASRATGHRSAARRSG